MTGPDDSVWDRALRHYVLPLAVICVYLALAVILVHQLAGHEAENNKPIPTGYTRLVKYLA